MKTTKLICAFLLVFAVVACNNNSTTNKNTVLTVNTLDNYTDKELIIQDYANVEYTPLETKDDVLIENYGRVAYASNDTTIVFNMQHGDIFIFNNKGKCIGKFNKKGASAREYNNLSDVLYLPKEKEIMVIDSWNKRKIFVYNVNGDFKRVLPIIEGYQWNKLVSYNDSLLLCYDTQGAIIMRKGSKPSTKPFVFVSKKDGEIIDNLGLEVPERLSTSMIISKGKRGMSVRYYNIKSILAYNSDFIINEISADTIYSYTPQKQLKPFIVKQPDIQKMKQEERVWLDVRELSDNYIVMQKAKGSKGKTPDYERTDLLVDRATNKICQGKWHNADLKGDNAEKYARFGAYLINADILLDALDAGKLSGKLKAIAEKLDVEDNPVMVKVTLK